MDRCDALVVGGGPAGSTCAAWLRRAGLDVLYLGADVPLEAWRRTIEDADPVAVVLAVVSRADIGPASEVIRALRHDGGRLIAIGGPAAADIAADLGAIPLPDRLQDAVSTLLEVAGPAAS